MPGVATINGSNWILPFTDGVLATGQLPQIGGTFDTVTINNTSISESFPTTNCAASTRVVNTHSYSIPLFNNATTTSVVSSAVAIANGTVTYTQVFACAMSAVNISGIETIGTPTCNAGYQVSGSSCVAIPPSSGGGGGWSVYTPPVILTTPVSTGSVSTGSINTGTLTVPIADWIPSTSASVDTLSAGTLDTRYFTDLTVADTYLKTKITTPAVLKLANSYKDKLTIPDVTYYVSIDQNLYSEYNRVINAYVLLFLRVQDAVNGNKSDAVKTDGRKAATVVSSGVTLARNFLDRYIVRAYLPEQNITVYRIKNPALSKALAALETKVLAKFDRLLASGTISRAEYDTAIQAYDDFILHLSLYRDYGRTKLSKDRALVAIKIFTTIYAKKIIDTGDISLSNELAQKQQAYTEATKKLVGEVYTFSKDLGIGDKNQDVTNLQTILKSYEYFGTLSPTGYFGTLTANYLTKFSRDILGVSNPNGLFNSTIRNAIVKIELK
ncbi:MAG: hypothetical protein ACD_78C00267G0002 [uncultured bacterium (gcode 4)]|uniref:Peptidoglycan binding-like domain-containing protein n=1 Tax=uncultured bacterium (gcode 4) TaxID=1234023 RepID=K1XXV2_9BACT|nr:MAG: hypothetical protein ACD_78C00267G0002 [uncultured bacterium (gcode 4)]